MKPLTVYKASAGSGKTFTLAVEYIKLLIDNPLSFKNILAVTFTNKATEEMKMRILSQLFGIWKLLPESDVYIKNVCESLGINEKQASRQAGIALNYIVHNYHYFRVETIDSFFQSVLRNLARELDLTPNLKIGLNDVQVEEQAVDQLVESLSPDSLMLQWLISYIFSNISENKSWNVIGQIKNFGKAIFRDFYKMVSNDVNVVISDKETFDKYVNQIRTIRTDAKKRMAKYAETFEHETEIAGLTTLSYAKKNSGIVSYFNKLKSDDFSDSRCMNQTLQKCLDNAESWTTKTSPDREVIISLVNEKLMALLHEAENERSRQWRLFSTANVTLKHLDKLRLLNSIESKVRELNDESNRFLLSDTQYLLYTLINDNDTPFIFEKSGCMLEHIMIDEFQDTSSIQWQNFKILLKECMSKSRTDGNTINNLIVGDVKQSIYRWRAGDWRLLNGIERQFGQQFSDMDVRTLQTNYRSERNIIEFNNCFFRVASRLEYAQELEINDEANALELLTAYADVCQATRNGKKRNGLVRVSLLADDDYEDKMLSAVDDAVQELLSSGARMNDIAILIRYNRHIPLIADYFMANHPDLKIVSDEAFRLDASLAVNMIIQSLEVLLHPDDLLAKASLVSAYQKNILQKDFGSDDMFTTVIGNLEQLDCMLPCDFVSNMNDLMRMPLIDMIESLYSMFELDKLKGQNAYICAFYDQVADFSNNNSGNLAKFIETWNTDICGKTIQSDDTDGIRLVSIHKSKGLEFDHVIIPFCDWALESRDTTLWCTPHEKPFGNIPIVPVDYSKKLLETIYAGDYKNEHIQNRVDNMNLLYVAFTRASKNLFVFGRKKCGKGGLGCRSQILRDCMLELNSCLEGSVLNGTDSEDEPEVFEYGKLYIKSPEGAKVVSDNVFMEYEEHKEINIESYSLATEFRQSNKSREFIEGDVEDVGHDTYVKLGSVLHNLFSRIGTVNDIDKVLKQLEFDGVIYNEIIIADKLKKLLLNRLSDKRTAYWFEPHWQVFSECSILQVNENGEYMERRPDRVVTDGHETIVIDFKFGKPRNEHKKQVRQYMELLTDMGYKSVKGRIWYVFQNEIVEI